LESYDVSVYVSFGVIGGVAGVSPARRGSVRLGGAKAEARGQLPKASVVTDRLRAVMIEPSSWDLNEVKVPCFPLYYRGHFFAKFLNKGCQKGVYNCIFQAVPNDTFKYAHLQKRLILCKLI